MKAAYIERHGGPEALKFGEMPDPVAASGQVVVDIVAASVNGADWKVREGKSGQLANFPYILGRGFFRRGFRRWRRRYGFACRR
jgi:NADPH:quinone reductase-like Zn-dependent oxidoreductase